jgi:iron complex outermembrane recepter protein
MLSLTSQSAFNPQAALLYRVDSNSKVRASISQKTYMPSMKDRYSRRFGRTAPNVDLDKEIANHIELSYLFQKESISSSLNVYYSKVKDAIQEAVFTPDPSMMQLQNVGDFEHKGTEIDTSYKTATTKVGGNYSFVDVKNKKDESIKRTGIPKHQLFVYGQQVVGAGFSLYANMKLRSGVYEQIDDGSYVDMATFSTFDAKVIYEPMASLCAEVGVKNLTDKYVQYNIGFPEAGREYFATLNYKF